MYVCLITSAFNIISYSIVIGMLTKEVNKIIVKQLVYTYMYVLIYDVAV